MRTISTPPARPAAISNTCSSSQNSSDAGSAGVGPRPATSNSATATSPATLAAARAAPSRTVVTAQTMHTSKPPTPSAGWRNPCPSSTLIAPASARPPREMPNSAAWAGKLARSHSRQASPHTAA